MTDHFLTLGERRRPWLDAEELKQKFHQLSANVHPDRVHQQDAKTRQNAAAVYADLNAAYQCLSHHKSRLEHLVQLERGTKPGDLRAIPDDVVHFFGAVGNLLRETNALLAEKAQASSPILKAVHLQRALPYLERITGIQNEIQSRLEHSRTELKLLDERWQHSPATPEERLDRVVTAEKFYHLFGFFERWQGQLQERSFQLTV